MKLGKKKKIIETPTVHENKIYKKPTKKGKSGDYRRWARKYMKDGGRSQLGIEKMGGIGEGTKRYCVGCKCPPSSSLYKNGGCWCGTCSGYVKTYKPKDYDLLYNKLKYLPKWLWNILDKRLSR